MAVSGITFVLAVHDGVSTFNTLAGQRSTTANRSTDSADATTKDDSGWHIDFPTIRNWSFDVSGILTEADEAYVDLEDAWEASTTVQVRITTPGGTTYTGYATVSDLTTEGPHDDVVTYSVSLTGATALTKA